MIDSTARSIIVEQVMPHPPEKIWRALTEGSLLERWLMKNDFQPVQGHRFQFRADPRPQWNGVTDCEVLAVEPHQRLSYRWRSSGDEARDGLDTVVTWTLAPAEGGTLLRMEHAGFRPEDDGFHQGASHGWQRMVDGLERVAAELG